MSQELEIEFPRKVGLDMREGSIPIPMDYIK